MSAALREALTQSIREALAELDPARLVREALPPLPPKRARVRVVAAGKAAIRMVEGAMARWPDRIEDALAITTAPIPDHFADPRITAMASAHPIPDDRSVAAADEAIARAGSLGQEDLLLALISGGASALLAAPPRGMTLDDKRAVVAALLERGAPIREVNLVRRHLSRIKGGRLALAAAPARTLSLIVSDVISGEAFDVGSGPSVPDPTTIAEAREILQRFAPDLGAEAWLEESPKPETKVAMIGVGASVPFGSRVRAQIVADPAALARAVAAALGRRGIRAAIDPPEEGDASAVALRRVARAASIRSGEAVVIACEPVLRLPRDRGQGGRAGWIALSAMRKLPAGVMFLAAASDGVDGSSGTAGAVVEGGSGDRDGVSDAMIDAALEGFDDASIHRALGSHLEGGPTGHNLTDVHVIARA